MDASSGRTIVARVPPLQGDPLRARAPTWLTVLLRGVSGLFAITTAWLVVGTWSTTPTWVRALAALLVPAFLWMALHPRGWARLSRVPFFCADARGLWLPSRHLGPDSEPSRWLFLPWSEVSEVRVAKVGTGDGTSGCAAFDAMLSPEEVREFFVGTIPTAADPRCASVAFYVNAAPTPRTIVERLTKIATSASHRTPSDR